MAMASFVIVALLCSTILFSAPPPVHSYIGNPCYPYHKPRSLKYKHYIVDLKPRADAALTVDDSARRRWCLSFLPSNVTDSGESRLICLYESLDGFAAWLTETELEVMSKKPGFRSWMSGDRMLYLM